MRKEPLPLFCNKCEHMRQGILTGERYCRMTCKYNPPLRYMASQSYYKRSRDGVLAGI